MCVAPVKVVDIADVAKQGVFVLRAQRRAGLVADALQVVLKEMRKNTGWKSTFEMYLHTFKASYNILSQKLVPPSQTTEAQASIFIVKQKT